MTNEWTRPPAPLSERAELASADWIQQLRVFADAYKLDSDEVPSFRVSARFDDPPPHLGLGTSCGYTVNICRNGISVSDRFDESADWYRHSDYNAAIPFATRVIGHSVEDDERIFHEYSTLFAEKYHEFHDANPRTPSVLRFMSDLQNHMARRTVNNPDVAHRIEKLGLSSNANDLDTKGYTILEGAFTREYADALRAATKENHDSAPPNTGFRATMLLKRGRLWEEAVIHPWVLALMEYLLGRGCLLYQSDTIVKGPELDTHPGLHADYGASRITEPFPEYCLEATCIWAIDEFSLENGPTVVIPESFNRRKHVPAGTTREGAKPLVMPQGSIAMWHGGLWHGAMPRSAPGERHSLHNAYVRHFMRPLEFYYDIDQRIVDRNPPAFSTLCGLDDALGKSGNHGADFERLNYARIAGFGSIDQPYK